jgi:hypothetical protein
LRHFNHLRPLYDEGESHQITANGIGTLNLRMSVAMPEPLLEVPLAGPCSLFEYSILLSATFHTPAYENDGLP